LGKVGHGVCIEDKAATFGNASAQGRPEATDGYLLTLVNIAPTLEGMDVQLSPDQRAFYRLALKTGRLSSEEDAVAEALLLWEERERTRAETLALADSAEESLSRGQGRVITEASMRELANDVKQRGRARLAAEQAVSI